MFDGRGHIDTFADGSDSGNSYAKGVIYIRNSSNNMTTFLWNDLVGVTGMTSSSGISESYEYDSKMRPFRTRDTEGKLVREQNYHLKNE